MVENFSWLNNQWFVGLATAVAAMILNWLVVTPISRYFLSKSENREYLQRIYTTNREMLYSIRPAISEGNIPKPETINALIAATARRYAVKDEDLYGPTEILQELIKEVMDSSFLSSHTKQEYCERLTAVIPKVSNESLISKISAIEFRMEAQKQRLKKEGSEYVVAGIFSLLFSWVGWWLYHHKNVLPKLQHILLPLILSAVVILLVVLMAIYIKKFKVLKKQNTKKLNINKNIRLGVDS